jgi:uncharacterized membrane protein YfcA
MTHLDALILVAAGFAGGVVNALAGGGTLITFPALLGVGLAPKLANATSQVALWPGRLTSVLAQWSEFRSLGRGAWSSIVIGLIGGFIGAQALIAMSPAAFRALVPWLLLAASLLFGFAGPITRWVNARARGGGRPAAVTLVGRASEFVTCVYGGFFGAGLGVILLAGYALAGMHDLKRSNVLKNMMGVVITTTSALTFIVRGEVAWGPAGALLLGALAGGWCGGRLARFIPDRPLRILITAAGIALAVVYFVA